MLLYEGCNHGLMLWVVLVFDVVGCVGMELFEEETNVCNRLQEGGKGLPAKKLEYVPKVGGCSLFLVEGLPTLTKLKIGICTKSWWLLPVSGRRAPKWLGYLLNQEGGKRLPAKKLEYVPKVGGCSLFLVEGLPSGLWQVRAWMETSDIVHMNSLLRARHQRRIRETPFKWFLDIVNPIELNMKLFKQLVRRWVPQHHSFRVRHQLVPFDVVDVVMTLGLGVGGLVVPFNESIVGKVGQLFNSSETKIKDMINMFDNIVLNDDIDVDVIANSISISGSAVVLQLWAYERLDLHYHSSVKVFPRLRRFRSLKYGTEAIDLLFRKGEGKSDGAPEKGDENVECARAARLEKFRTNIQKIRSLKDEICDYGPKSGVVVDGEGNVEGADAAPVEEAPPEGIQEADADAVQDVVHQATGDAVLEEACVEEALGHETAADEDGAHQAACEAVVEEIGVVAATVEGTPVCETTADEDGAHQAACEAVVEEIGAVAATVEGALVCKIAGDEDGAHQAACEAVVDEIGVDAAAVEGAPVHETAVVENGAHEAAFEAVVDEIGADAALVELAPVYETTAAADEQPFPEEAVDEEYLGDEVPERDPPAFVDIGGDDQDDEIIPHAELMVLEPLTTDFGDLRARVDLDKLYQLITRKDIVTSYVCEITGQLLSTKDCSSLGPREDVDNMVIMFAATMLMYSEKKSTGVIRRMIFNPMFASQLIYDNKRRIANRHVWQLVDYWAFFQPDLVILEDLVTADWVFIPVVTKDHWWCYALKVCSMQFFVIDSLEKGISGRAGIDRSMAKNIQRFWGLLTNTIEDSKICLNVQQAKIPVQPNTLVTGDGLGHSEWVELMTTPLLFLKKAMISVIAYTQQVIAYQLVTGDGLGHSEWVELMTTPLLFLKKGHVVIAYTQQVIAYQLVTGDGLGHSELVQLMTTHLLFLKKAMISVIAYTQQVIAYQLVTGDGLGHSEWVELMTTPLLFLKKGHVLVTGDGLGHSEWVELMTTHLLFLKKAMISVIAYTQQVIAYQLVTGDGLGHSEWVELMRTHLLFLKKAMTRKLDFVLKVQRCSLRFLVVAHRLVTGDGLGHSELVQLMTTHLLFLKKAMSDEMKETCVL
ncbi:hypothetical protein V8G54_000183 (mitochondrion) [Vigna mungo]|uniref:Ubiquitin-like protease family profile domain-containing protein n=1 Tax=Vigna mungo TaxID=3915 RepID=A0AAQ3PKG3_VIGMU